LAELGYASCFDEIYGTSAGALNGAYFIAGQIAMGASIYYENLTGRNFIDMRCWPEVMNLHYLFDGWVTGGKPLDAEGIVHADTRLFITVTDIEAAHPVFLESGELSAGELVAALRASAATPMFTVHREKIRGRWYNDGAVTAGLPLAPALARNCTHLLCLLTRPHGYRKRRHWWIAPYERLRLHRYSPAYRRAFRDRIRNYNDGLVRLHRGDGPPATLVVAPEAGEGLLRNAESDPDRLRRAAARSFQQMVHLLRPEDAAGLRFRPWTAAPPPPAAG
jgi:predicted patatin/cPLA2 family phospholipase